MRKSAIAAGLLAVVTFVSGCGGAADAPKVSAKADVAGTVTLDGKPMEEENAEISFVVGAGTAPIILPIKGGKFEGKAAVGEARVEVRSFKKGAPIMMDGKPFGEPVKENYIAEEFNDKSTLKATVASGGSKDLKFEVQKKK